MMYTGEKLLFDFTSPEESHRWRIVNDVVMGGLSQSVLQVTLEKTGLFEGTVSLENQGGFASAWTGPKDFDLGDFEGLLARLKGDGKLYKVKLKTELHMGGMAYETSIETRPGAWIVARLPFAAFVPTFRGSLLSHAEPLDSSQIKQIGFMISDKQVGAFRLEIEWVKAYRAVP